MSDDDMDLALPSSADGYDFTTKDGLTTWLAEKAPQWAEALDRCIGEAVKRATDGNAREARDLMVAAGVALDKVRIIGAAIAKPPALGNDPETLTADLLAFLEELAGRHPKPAECCTEEPDADA